MKGQIFMKKWTSTLNDYFKKEIIKNYDDKKVDVIIDDKILHQKHLGFGGAFTDAACYIFNQLDDDNKNQVIDLLFNENGLNYNLGRLTIGSCDFSTNDYDYSKKFDSSDFSIAYEFEHIDPFLKRVMEIKKMTLIAAPWAPPVFYKNNNEKGHGGKLKEDHYKDYAKYLCNYIQKQQERHIPLKYITMQNEPEAYPRWESCLYSSNEELKLLKLVIEESKNYNFDIKYLLWDHNRDVIVRREQEYSDADPNYINLVDGFAYHWYDGDKWDNLKTIHDKHPDKLLLFTEGCIEGFKNLETSMNTFNGAIRYAKNYIHDSLNFSNGFIDWNLLLDQYGGPNHVANYCEALIQYDLEKKKLYINPTYYAVKHFANYIKPNAYRIETINNTNILITSYINPDKSIVVVILNENEEKNITIQIKNNKYRINLPTNSITTLLEE